MRVETRPLTQPPTPPRTNQRRTDVRIVSIDLSFPQVMLLVCKVMIVAFPFLLAFSAAIVLVLSGLTALLNILF